MDYYGPKMRALIDSATEDFRSWLEDNEDTMDVGDAIFETTDSSVPIYNSEILETISESPSLWSRETELGPAFDGAPTPVNIAAGVIFEVINEALWEAWNEREDEEE